LALSNSLPNQREYQETTMNFKSWRLITFVLSMMTGLLMGFGAVGAGRSQSRG
jgi:hypothetical protein